MKEFVFLITAAIWAWDMTAGISQEQWQLQTTISGDPELTSVKVVSRDVAWIASADERSVYRTTNGGATWSQRPVTTSDFAVSLEAIDSTTAFVGAGSLTGNAGIYRTTDGGQSWQLVYFPSDPNNTYWFWIHFFDHQNGIAACDRLIVTTVDSGDSWTPIADQPGFNMNEYGEQNCGYCYDNLHCWFGTVPDFGPGVAGRVFRTIDGGNSWTGFNSGNSLGVAAVRFISPIVGIRISETFPYLTRSTNGGQTWSVQFNLPVVNIQRLQAATSVSTENHSQFWIYGEAGPSFTPFILSSTDSGVTWQEQTIANLSGNSVHHMSAITFGAANDSVQAFAVTKNENIGGGGGQVLNYRQSVGLVTAVREAPSSSPLRFTLSHNYPNPFNPQTTIRFLLAESSQVRLTIYNALGIEIARLVDMEMPAGSHDVIWDAGKQASGVYFYRLTAKNISESNKMVLLR